MGQNKIDYEKLIHLTNAYHEKLANEFLDKLDDMLSTKDPLYCKTWYKNLFPQGTESDDETIRISILKRFSTLMSPKDTTLSENEINNGAFTLNQIFQRANVSSPLYQNVSSPLYQIGKKMDICTKLIKALDNKDINKCRLIINNGEESGQERLKAQRNPGWDMFLTVISALIFPIAIGRSIHSKLAYDTFDFNISDGEKLTRKFKKELGAIESETCDTKDNSQYNSTEDRTQGEDDSEYGEAEPPSEDDEDDRNVSPS